MCKILQRNAFLKQTDRFRSLAEWVVVSFSVVILSCLTFLVFLYCFNSEDSIPMKSNIIVHLFSFIILVSVCRLLGGRLNPYPQFCKAASIILLISTLIYVAAVCFSYVSQTLLLPISDGKSCYDIALRFYESEFGAVVPEGSYLSLWPYQTGLIFITEKLMRIFGRVDPLFFQQINCFYVLLIIASGYCMMRLFTKKIEGCILYLFLMANYWPLLFRVSEVYGDLPGLAWTMVSMTCYMLWAAGKEGRGTKIIAPFGFACSTIIACTYKGNCLIYIVALVLITFVQQLQKINIKMAAMVAVTVCIAVSATSITQKYYEHYAGNVCGKGMPAVGWIAMGLQYNGEEAIPGGWNGFHSSTFIESGYDYDATVSRSKESIRASLDQFVKNPSFAGHFFYYKILKQWANQTHGIWWGMGDSYDVSRAADAYWVHFTEAREYDKKLPFVDLHESMVYGILLLGCIALLKRKLQKQELSGLALLPFVTFIGGFLFSIIWEAQTGAVMSYPIMLLPAAVGLAAEIW